MSKRSNIIRKSFQYDYSKKMSTIVEFDIVEDDGKKVAKNIILTSNWRAHYPNYPQIIVNPDGVFAFAGDGINVTNGDIQQMIRRVFQIIEKTSTS